MIKKTIDKDLEVVQNAQGSFFTGVDDVQNNYLDIFVTGYAFIYWVQLPSWFEKDEDLKYFKQMTQKNFRSFSGIGALDLATNTVQTGFAAHEINVAGAITRNNTDFTISHKEYSGGVMRKMYQKWVSMIRDPRTGIALYPKLYGVDYGARNHTGQLLYIVTRPDATNTDKKVVEYACFYTNVLPTNVPLDTLYNFEIGNQESPTIDITFKGFPEIGPDVEAYAAKVLADKIMTSTGDGFIPFIDSYNSNTIEDGSLASSKVSWGSADYALGNVIANSQETEK